MARRCTVRRSPLCASGDVFTQDEVGVVRQCNLPPAQVGDLLVLHDTGADGASMSSNYYTRPLIPEVLIEAGQPRLAVARTYSRLVLNKSSQCASCGLLPSTLPSAPCGLKDS